jgi:hypothetical protein
MKLIAYPIRGKQKGRTLNHMDRGQDSQIKGIILKLSHL